MPQLLIESIVSAGLVGISVGILLLLRSLANFSRTGPEIRKEVQEKFFFYSIYALSRLVLWSVLITLFFAFPGSLLGVLACQYHFQGCAGWLPILTGLLSFMAVTSRQLLYFLLHNPGIIATSANFNTARLYGFWQQLSPAKLQHLDYTLIVTIMAATIYMLMELVANGDWLTLAALVLLLCLYTFSWIGFHAFREPVPVKRHNQNPQSPNILMIGSDTLRADHLGAYGYHRNTSPFIDSLAKRSTLFERCYVPLARTAPSLVSLFTGCWPDSHGIKDNFISDRQAKQMKKPSLASCLQSAGYRTSAISDWSGADLGKFDLGFQTKKLPEDQWNIKYLIRQGPKDIRLFLSLFCHNKFGKQFLPELYYLAGIPLTQQLGLEARRELAALTQNNSPFLLNVFLGTTHPPFSSNYPYYQLYSDPEYRGRSIFCMSRLTSPEEVIKSQQDPKEAFDLEQIIALYDGSIRQFDDEVQKIVQFLEDCQLADNTIIVIYSDHGMELFEHDTWGQGNSIANDLSAHIPLIIHAPGCQSDIIHRDPVRSLDLMPTLLDLCHIPIPESVEGVSLKPVIQGKLSTQALPIYYETGIWLSPPPKQNLQHITYPDIFNLLEISDPKTGTLSIRPEFIETIETARDWFIWQDPWKLKCYALQNGPHFELYNTDANSARTDNLLHQETEIRDRLVALRQSIRNRQTAGEGSNLRQDKKS